MYIDVTITLLHLFSSYVYEYIPSMYFYKSDCLSSSVSIVIVKGFYSESHRVKFIVVLGKLLHSISS